MPTSFPRFRPSWHTQQAGSTARLGFPQCRGWLPCRWVLSEVAVHYLHPAVEAPNHNGKNEIHQWPGFLGTAKAFASVARGRWGFPAGPGALTNAPPPPLWPRHQRPTNPTPDSTARICVAMRVARSGARFPDRSRPEHRVWRGRRSVRAPPSPHVCWFPHGAWRTHADESPFPMDAPRATVRRCHLSNGDCVLLIRSNRLFCHFLLSCHLLGWALPRLGRASWPGSPHGPLHALFFL